MKTLLLFLLLPSMTISIIAGPHKGITDEETWQKVKEEVMSGKVAYSILGLVVASIGVRHLWLWHTDKRKHVAEVKKIAQERAELNAKADVLEKILDENTQANVMEDEILKILLELKNENDAAHLACQMQLERFQKLTIAVTDLKNPSNTLLNYFYKILEAYALKYNIPHTNIRKTTAGDLVEEVSIVLEEEVQKSKVKVPTRPKSAVF